MPIRQQPHYSLLTLALILAIFEATSIDLWLQNTFYDSNATQLVILLIAAAFGRMKMPIITNRRER